MVAKGKSPLQPQAEIVPALTADKIQWQLQRILTSSEFNATERQREFLKFVVAESIAGRAQEIKGYTVATRVFGRKGDFDQTIDPIVSIQAGGLRRALERYYLVAGQDDPVRIDIPKGTFVPAFLPQGDGETAAVSRDKAEPSAGDGLWPTLMVRPFRNLTGDPDLDYLAIGLATELAAEITRYQEVMVLMSGREGPTGQVKEPIARFAVDGDVRRDSSGVKVTVRLIDLSNNQQIWSDSHFSDLEVARMIRFQEEVAQVIAAKIAGEYGVIVRTVSVESRNRPPSRLNTYEAILRFYEYDQTLNPKKFMNALSSLQQAAAIEPECGLVLSLLARLYTQIYSLDIPVSGLDNPLEKAVEYAEEGAHLAPNNQRALGILALVHFFNNELPAAIREVDRALELNPNSLFVMDGLAYIMILAGEFERGKALAAKAIRLNPFYRPIIHYALWVDGLRREEYEQSYRETMGLRRPAVFWYPLAKAATLGLLGRKAEGKKYVDKLLLMKPDFPGKGRDLIGRYIKFGEIAERVVKGLSRVGLDMDQIVSKKMGRPSEGNGTEPPK
jgi:adenylate cyclase